MEYQNKNPTMSKILLLLLLCFCADLNAESDENQEYQRLAEVLVSRKKAVGAIIADLSGNILGVTDRLKEATKDQIAPLAEGFQDSEPLNNQAIPIGEDIFILFEASADTLQLFGNNRNFVLVKKTDEFVLLSYVEPPVSLDVAYTALGKLQAYLNDN